MLTFHTILPKLERDRFFFVLFRARKEERLLLLRMLLFFVLLILWYAKLIKRCSSAEVDFPEFRIIGVRSVVVPRVVTLLAVSFSIDSPVTVNTDPSPILRVVVCKLGITS